MRQWRKCAHAPVEGGKTGLLLATKHHVEIKLNVMLNDEMPIYVMNNLANEILSEKKAGKLLEKNITSSKAARGKQYRYDD